MAGFDLAGVGGDAFAGAVGAAAVAGVELPAVPGAGDDAVDAGSFGQGAAGVWAGVVEGDDGWFARLRGAE